MLDDFKVCEIDIIYHPTMNPKDRPQITCAEDAYKVFRTVWDDNKINLVEDIKIMYLNTANRVLGISDISRGGISGTVADTRIIFAGALKAAATNIIVAHNHPSHNLVPSENDIKLTRKLKSAGDILDINVLDHLIITPNGFSSYETDWTTLKITSPRVT